jgi:RND family efflux transporter MFP subunit
MNQQGNLQVLRRQAVHLGNGSAAVSIPLPPRRWKTRILVPGLIITAAVVILVFATHGALRSAVPVKIVPAVLKAGVQSSAAVVVQAPGWVEPNPYPVSVTALADGVVHEVAVLEGQPVQKGQVVARLIPDDAKLALERADAELSQRKAELATAQALFNEAQRNWDHPIELRRRLAAAEATLAEKQAELARWPAELAAEKARMAELKSEYERLSKLRADGVAAEREFIRAQRQHEAQAALVRGAEGRQAVLEAQIRAAQAEIAATREALELRIPETRALAAARAEVLRSEAAVERAQVIRAEAALRLDRMEVRSPADGVVMARLIEPGSQVMLSGNETDAAQVLRLYEPTKLQVRVDVPLGDAARVALTQQAEVVVNVLPDKVFRGQVVRIVHQADIQKNTLQVKVAIDRPTPHIKPEMLARVRFLAAAATQPAGTQASIFIPARLISRQDGKESVWLVDQTRGVAESRSITVGTAREGDWVEVRDGLRAGDWLIADPSPGLLSGEAVKVVGEYPSSGSATEER